MENCKKCNEPINENFCSYCGQPTKLKKIDGQYLVHEIGDFLSANKGFLFTIKRLFVSPGNAVRDFITEDRYRFVKPITFLFITSVVYAIINQIFNFGVTDYAQQSGLEEGSTANLVFKWMLIDYPGYSGIITGFFVAFWIKLFFRKSGYNIFEIFILICFVTGVTTLFMSAVAIFQGLTHVRLLETASYALILYLIWAVGQFFDGKKVRSYVKAFFAYLLGISVLGVLIVIVGEIIDALK
jgi:hypothetical protein